MDGADGPHVLVDLFRIPFQRDIVDGGHSPCGRVLRLNLAELDIEVADQVQRFFAVRVMVRRDLRKYERHRTALVTEQGAVTLLHQVHRVGIGPVRFADIAFALVPYHAVRFKSAQRFDFFVVVGRHIDKRAVFDAIPLFARDIPPGCGKVILNGGRAVDRAARKPGVYRRSAQRGVDNADGHVQLFSQFAREKIGDGADGHQPPCVRAFIPGSAFDVVERFERQVIARTVVFREDGHVEHPQIIVRSAGFGQGETLVSLVQAVLHIRLPARQPQFAEHNACQRGERRAVGIDLNLVIGISALHTLRFHLEGAVGHSDCAARADNRVPAEDNLHQNLGAARRAAGQPHRFVL
ncbi:MAG: hypothetical protein BWY37_01794 [Firmicutes bacterium ADurb.Bin262]|nr:MAG: hypothetical protein BWY37_01794 [Firmicutes bacterium ADurb.Bin262]